MAVSHVKVDCNQADPLPYQDTVVPNELSPVITAALWCRIYNKRIKDKTNAVSSFLAAKPFIEAENFGRETTDGLQAWIEKSSK